jgi:uncharacterized membrane protein
MTLQSIVMLVGGLLSALVAGLFADFSLAVVPGLRSLRARQHIEAMQSINRRIINPFFMLSFLGPTILLPAAAVLHWGTAQFLTLVAAALLHIIGVNGITIAGNVPLNNRLAQVSVDRLSEGEAEAVRTDYQGAGARWMRLHNLRTLAAVLMAALVFFASLSRD